MQRAGDKESVPNFCQAYQSHFLPHEFGSEHAAPAELLATALHTLAAETPPQAIEATRHGMRVGFAELTIRSTMYEAIGISGNRETMLTREFDSQSSHFPCIIYLV